MERRKIGGYRLYWRTKEQDGGVALMVGRGLPVKTTSELAGLAAIFRDFPDLFIDDDGVLHTDLLRPGSVKD